MNGYRRSNITQPKKDKIRPYAATWMKLQIIILNEVRNRKTNTYDITYMWNLRYDKKELTYETDRLMDMENRLVTAREEG